MTAGRPRRWTDATELQSRVDGYFEQFKGNNIEGHEKYKKAPSLFGLCRFVGMSYDAFIDYESGSMDTETEKFSVSLIDARLRCLEDAGENVYQHTAGAVFVSANLTRKFKEPWKNAQHQEVTGANGGPVKFEITPNQAGIT